MVSDTYCTLSDWGRCDYQEKENSCKVMNGLFKSFTGRRTRLLHADLHRSFSDCHSDLLAMILKNS